MSGYTVDYSQPKEEKDYWQKKASEALDKQIPMQVLERQTFMGVDCAKCPSCGTGTIGERKYCHECGQRLKW